MNFRHLHRLVVLTLVILCAGPVLGQLGVTVTSLKIAGQKAVVELALTNGLLERIESARAAVFLMNDEGKVVAQGTRWIIGGSENQGGLERQRTNIFNFVVSANERLAPNITAKVIVNRVVLEKGKLADVNADVKISPQ